MAERYHVYAIRDFHDPLGLGETTLATDVSNLREARSIAVQEVAKNRDPVQIARGWDGLPIECWQWNFKTRKVENVGPSLKRTYEYSTKYGI